MLSSVLSGYAGYKLCYYEMMRVIKGIVHQPYELKGSSIFYAFSYYYDRAKESGLIGKCVLCQPLLNCINNLTVVNLKSVFPMQTAEVELWKSEISRRKQKKVLVIVN